MSGTINISSDWTITGDSTNNTWTVTNNQTNDDLLTVTEGGVVRTPNAGVRVEANGSPSSGAGLEMRNTSSSRSVVMHYDRDNSIYGELELHGDPLTLDGRGGLIDASASAANLRLATGQFIEDGSGTNRFEINNGGTRILDENGNYAAVFDDSSSYGFRAYNGTPVKIQDKEGGFDALQYISSSSAPGTLELTEADMVVGQQTTGNSHEIYFDEGSSTKPLIQADSGEVKARDNAGNSTTLT